MSVAGSSVFKTKEGEDDAFNSRWKNAQRKRAQVWRVHWGFGSAAWSRITSHISQNDYQIYVGKNVMERTDEYQRTLHPYITRIKNDLMHYAWCDGVIALAVVSVRLDNGYIPSVVLLPPETYQPVRVWVPESDDFVWRIRRLKRGPDYKSTPDHCSAMPHFRMDRGIFMHGGAEDTDSFGDPIGCSLDRLEDLLVDAKRGITNDAGVIVIDPRLSIPFKEHVNSPVESYIQYYLNFLDKLNLSSQADKRAVNKRFWAEFDPKRSETGSLGGTAVGAYAPNFFADSWANMNEQEAREYMARAEELYIREEVHEDNAAIAGLKGDAVPIFFDSDGSPINSGNRKAGEFWAHMSKKGIAPILPGWTIPATAVQAAKHENIDVRTAWDIARSARNAAYGLSENMDFSKTVVKAGVAIEQEMLASAINQCVEIINSVLTRLFNHFYRSGVGGGAFDSMFTAYDMLVVPAIERQICDFLRREAGTDQARCLAETFNKWSNWEYGPRLNFRNSYKELYAIKPKQAFSKTHHGDSDYSSGDEDYQEGEEDEEEKGSTDGTGRLSVNNLIKKINKKKNEQEEDEDSYYTGDMTYSEYAPHTKLFRSIVAQHIDRIRGADGLNSLVDTTTYKQQPSSLAEQLIDTITKRSSADFQFFSNAGFEQHAWVENALRDALEQTTLAFDVVIPQWTPSLTKDDLKDYALCGVITPQEFVISMRKKGGFPVKNVPRGIIGRARKILDSNIAAATHRNSAAESGQRGGGSEKEVSKRSEPRNREKDQDAAEEEKDQEEEDIKTTEEEEEEESDAGKEQQQQPPATGKRKAASNGSAAKRKKKS